MEKKPRFQSKPKSFSKDTSEKLSSPQIEWVTKSLIREDNPLPLLVQPKVADMDLAGWAEDHKDEIETDLLKYGSLLFRGFGVKSVKEFERVASSACNELFGKYGDLPSESEGEKIYKSTPYPNDKPILFHNESSHMPQWPSRQFFYCVQASPVGGNTPIIDCRRMYQALDPAIATLFREKGLLYVRNFTDRLDVSWQHFFKTEDPREVEAMCQRGGMNYEWWGKDYLRISQLGPGVITHPQTQELSFFNQIQLHHVGYLDEEVQKYYREMLKEEEYPRHVYFGDGSPISEEIIREVDRLYWDLSVAYPWENGDIIMVDNMLVAHARNTFEGPRKICVAMGDMISARAVVGGVPAMQPTF